MPVMTVTTQDIFSDDKVGEIMSKLSEEWEWVDRSSSIPITFNGVLHYTVTITYGNFE